MPVEQLLLIMLGCRLFGASISTKERSVIYLRRLENREQLGAHGGNWRKRTLDEIAKEIVHNPINSRYAWRRHGLSARTSASRQPYAEANEWTSRSSRVAQAWISLQR